MEVAKIDDAIFMQYHDILPLLKGKKIIGWILRASFTDKHGVKHYARDYGKRAFRIPLYA